MTFRKRLSSKAREERDPIPRDKFGRRVKVLCDDINCGGNLVYDRADSERYFQHTWSCDGLTHETPDSELIACGRTIFGPALRNAA